jgi:hypothetical protein
LYSCFFLSVLLQLSPRLLSFVVLFISLTCIFLFISLVLIFSSFVPVPPSWKRLRHTNIKHKTIT